MEYTISKTNRNGVILCSFLLILFILITGLLFLINTPAKIDIVERLIRNVIYLILFGYLMLAFFQYFRHYKRTILQGSILIIFIMELIFKSTLFSDIFESTWKTVGLLSVSSIWIVATIVLIFGLIRNKAEVYPCTYPLLLGIKIKNSLTFFKNIVTNHFIRHQIIKFSPAFGIVKVKLCF